MDNNKFSGVYQITNKINGKKYIGYTEQNCTSRWYQHIYNLKNNCHDNIKLQQDFNIYGLTAFNFELLNEINNKEDLLKTEQQYINKINFDVDYNLVNSSLADVERNIYSFISFINNKWLLPYGLNSKDIEKYKIYKQIDKDEIINKAIYHNLIDLPKSHVTFNRVIRFMIDTLGYVVESGRMKEKNKRYTYKLVVDFDEDYDVKKKGN